MTDPSITLVAGRLKLTLEPVTGGSISSFNWSNGGREFAILDSRSRGRDRVLDMGNFPMVPFVNRVRGSRFMFRGGEVRMSPNMSGDLSVLHGQGWLSPWSIDRAAERDAELLYRYDGGEWPWAYESRQRFALDEHGLTYALTCRNLSDEVMPCGLGAHPYFPSGPQTRLDTEVTHVWTIDEHVLPVDKVPAEGRFSLRDRLIDGQDLDHGFGGWGGDARISDPAWPFAIELRSPTARFFQVYSPAEGGYFVAEPVTHANAAMNAPEDQWPELGFEVLEPGAEMTLEMRIELTAP